MRIDKSSGQPEVPNAWLVPSHWTDLYIVLITFCDNSVVDRNTTTIHLDSNGTAWLRDAPDASFASIVYAVNGGPALVLDLREAAKAGLDVGPGDEIAFLEIWYHADAEGGDASRIQAEAFLTSDGFDAKTYKATSASIIQKGVHQLAGSEVLTWIIPEDRDSMVLSLFRGDGVMLDRLNIPLDHSDQ